MLLRVICVNGQLCYYVLYCVNDNCVITCCVNGQFRHYVLYVLTDSCVITCYIVLCYYGISVTKQWTVVDHCVLFISAF